MTERYFFDALDIRNYRAILSLHVQKFARINVIGGMNGAGKTTVLEALFSLLNMLDPTNFARPFVTRGIAPNIEVLTKYLFTSGAAHELRIQSDTRVGTVTAECTIDSRNIELVNAPASATANAPLQLSQPFVGLTTKFSIFGTPSFEYHLADAGVPQSQGRADFIVNTKGHVQAHMPPAVIISKSSLVTPQDAVNRFSSLIQQGQKDLVLELAKMIIPSCRDVIVLQDAGLPQLYAETAGSKFLPLSLMGEGASTIINIGLVILTTPNGVILLDEFDTAVHYSRLLSIWRFLLRSAKRVNCQIFATTHSRECIFASAQAGQLENSLKDCAYYRLDRADRDTLSTRYSAEEVLDADNDVWDLR